MQSLFDFSLNESTLSPLQLVTQRQYAVIKLFLSIFNADASEFRSFSDKYTKPEVSRQQNEQRLHENLNPQV